MSCPENNSTNSLVFFTPGFVARPCVGHATLLPRVLPSTKNPAPLSKVIPGTGDQGSYKVPTTSRRMPQTSPVIVS